jgi:xanthine dehydrogenase small subunit
MRDRVLFHVNGRACSARGEAAFRSLAEFLRAALQQTGTKVVCAEGDCGACTVLVGRADGDRLRYKAVDSCILFLYQLDGKHVVTVEGLAEGGRLHPVQEALIAGHGSQCGYCTPGFVMALAGLCQESDPADPQTLRLGLTGNLCRCTGYLPILEAASSLRTTSLEGRYPSAALLADLREQARQPLLSCQNVTQAGPSPPTSCSRPGRALRRPERSRRLKSPTIGNLR